MFEVGEKVSYYPAGQREEQRLHFPAEVVAVTPKRCRIRYQERDGGPQEKLVHPSRLHRQAELAL